MSGKFTIVSINTTHSDAELAASAFFDAGAGGVEIKDKQDFLDLIKSDIIWDYVDKSVLEASDTVRVSAAVDENDLDFAIRLENRLNEMKAAGSVSFGEITQTSIDAADFENEWKKYYKPIKTKNITVVPSWINYKPLGGEKVMRLDPGMAFGTGEHATTRMCLEMMEVSGKNVIDVGCGSGILGIAAAVCGAKSVYMCDIDPQAVEFAKKNAEANGVKAEIEQADLLSGSRTADFIFANITADVLIRLSTAIGDHLNEGGVIVLSGIIAERRNEVAESFEKAGFKIVSELASDGWRAMKTVRK
jgi:ribosomal protein L11 methyltransferase